MHYPNTTLRECKKDEIHLIFVCLLPLISGITMFARKIKKFSRDLFLRSLKSHIFAVLKQFPVIVMCYDM